MYCPSLSFVIIFLLSHSVVLIIYTRAFRTTISRGDTDAPDGGAIQISIRLMEHVDQMFVSPIGRASSPVVPVSANAEPALAVNRFPPYGYVIYMVWINLA